MWPLQVAVLINFVEFGKSSLMTAVLSIEPEPKVLPVQDQETLWTLLLWAFSDLVNELTMVLLLRPEDDVLWLLF